MEGNVRNRRFRSIISNILDNLHPQFIVFSNLKESQRATLVALMIGEDQEITKTEKEGVGIDSARATFKIPFVSAFRPCSNEIRREVCLYGRRSPFTRYCTSIVDNLIKRAEYYERP